MVPQSVHYASSTADIFTHNMQHKYICTELSFKVSCVYVIISLAVIANFCLVVFLLSADIEYRCVA